MTDWTKVALSAIGAVLLIALCGQLLFTAHKTAGSVAFALVFLLLLVGALRRVGK